MRAFIAFPLPPEIKEKLSAAQLHFKSCDLQAKWVNPENAHLTLKFLGEIDEETVEAVGSTLQRIAQKYKPVTVSLTKFGFFPQEKNPRVLFIATDKEEPLQKIAYDIEAEASRLGFNKEARFRSHITLARLKSKKNLECLKSKMEQTKLSGTFTIGEIVLFRSRLTPEGPIYQEIFKATLTP